MRVLAFTVPGEPVGKGRPQFAPATGRPHTPKKTAKYENLVALCFQSKYPDWAECRDMVEIDITAYFSIPQSWSKKKKAKAASNLIMPTKAPDADNIAKMKDALNEIAWHDDAQVVEEHIHKRFSDRPRVEFTIKFFTDEDVMNQQMAEGILRE